MGVSPVTWEAIYALAKICQQIYLFTKSGLHLPYESWLHLFENNSSCTPWPDDAYHKTTLGYSGSCADLRTFQSNKVHKFFRLAFHTKPKLFHHAKVSQCPPMDSSHSRLFCLFKGSVRQKYSSSLHMSQFLKYGPNPMHQLAISSLFSYSCVSSLCQFCNLYGFKCKSPLRIVWTILAGTSRTEAILRTDQTETLLWDFRPVQWHQGVFCW